MEPLSGRGTKKETITTNQNNYSSNNTKKVNVGSDSQRGDKTSSNNNNINTTNNLKNNYSSNNTKENSKKESEPNLTYTATQIIGSGSFGVVYQATVAETGEMVAIKKVYQDKRYKNRELEIIKELDHPNVIKLKNSFYTPGEKPDEVYLNAVMEYVPDTLSRVIRQYYKSKTQMPMIVVKLYAYQMMRSLAYIHGIGICHRDIKPQNILVDPTTHVLKLCDFGSAKKLVKGEPNVAYICSRYYRAPELIFGATEYTNQIDVWSIGCVIAELILGVPIFPGESAVDQLVEIIKILGTPSKQQIYNMNPDYNESKFPNIKPYPFQKLFRNKNVTEDFIGFLQGMLVYEPNLRFTPLKGLLHTFFDELRDQKTVLPSGKPLPKELFEFSPAEIKTDAETCRSLIPEWYYESQKEI